MAGVWKCMNCGTNDHTRTETHLGPRCETCTLIAIENGELCGLHIWDGLEGSGTSNLCTLLAGHREGHDPRGRTER